MEDSLHQTVLAAEEPPHSILKREESSKNPFKLLPDDLIVSHILDKISEAKSLCLISLVSRRFYSLVYQTQVISLRVDLYWARAPGQVLDFETSAKFLAKFSSIKSLYVELDYSRNLTVDVDPPVVKWKIDSESASFIVLTARSLRLTTTDDDNDQGNAVNPDLISLLRRFFNCCMNMACWRFNFVKMLVRLLPESLQKVVVADSKREGKVRFARRDIIRMRNGNSNFGDGETSIRVWHAPFLKLPSSGGVMKIVTLFISKGNERSDYDDLLIAKEAFDGEDDHQVYVEAAVEMMKRDLISHEVLPAQDFSFRLSLY
ncbi:F-box protein AUF2-like [Coffea arabica]|uniref:F-box protein AUF2-like n=1 Tax=Coffea arabica TaxID=13443 RepID=A0ABM4WM44_COFAR